MAANATFHLLVARADGDIARAEHLMADRIVATDRFIIEGLLGSAVVESVNLTVTRAHSAVA